MALIVSADTARARILFVAQQAEACKTSFANFVAEKPASSFSIDDRMARLAEIGSHFMGKIRSFPQFRAQLEAIRMAHHHLPEWNGNGDGNSISILFAEKQQLVQRISIEMTKFNIKTNEEFRGEFPQDNVPLFANPALSF